MVGLRKFLLRYWILSDYLILFFNGIIHLSLFFCVGSFYFIYFFTSVSFLSGKRAALESPPTLQFAFWSKSASAIQFEEVSAVRSVGLPKYVWEQPNGKQLSNFWRVCFISWRSVSRMRNTFCLRSLNAWVLSLWQIELLRGQAANSR